MNKNLIPYINILIKENENIIINVSLISSIVYFIIRSIDCLFLIPFPIGDEPIYVEEYLYFLSNGYVDLIQKGTSIFFILFSFLIDLFSGFEIFSLRIASFFSTIFLILYSYLRFKFLNSSLKKIFFIILLFLIPTTGASIHGTNDSLFFLSLLIFLFELVIFKGEKKNLLFLSAIFMIITRPVAIIYLGSLLLTIILYIFLILKKKHFHILKTSLNLFFWGFLFTL